MNKNKVLMPRPRSINFSLRLIGGLAWLSLEGDSGLDEVVEGACAECGLRQRVVAVH